MFPVNFARMIKSVGSESMVENFWVIRENSIFHNSIKISITCIGMFRKEALLEISKNPQDSMLLKGSSIYDVHKK